MGRIFSLCMIIAVVSFLGYTVENLWLAITKGYIDNRNMILPFLFGYGLALAAIYLVFGTPRDLSILGYEINIANEKLEVFLCFVIVMVVISLGEILLGKTVEKVCHIKWWDYSNLPLHLTQYTSLFTSIGFTVMIVLFMDKAFVPMYQWLLTWNPQVLAVSAIVLTVLMTLDFIHSAYWMLKHKSIMKIWTVDLTSSKLYKKQKC